MLIMIMKIHNKMLIFWLLLESGLGYFGDILDNFLGSFFQDIGYIDRYGYMV